MWDKSGNVYTFGSQAAHRTYYPRKNGSGTGCHYDRLVWKWGLSSVTNPFGQTISYTYYDKEAHAIHDSCTEIGSDTQPVDVAILPKSITYSNNQYQVYFHIVPRDDYHTGWTGRSSTVFFERNRLEKIEIRRGSDANGDGMLDDLIRRYALTFAGPTEAHIFPAITWDAGGKNLTLVKIQEFSFPDGKSLPATTFTYDDLHLVQADNGYGGRIEFQYEAWHDISAGYGQWIMQDFGAWLQPCYGVEGSGGWEARPGTSSQVSCYGDYLRVYNQAILNIKADLLRPGGRYKAVAFARSHSAIVSGRLGLTDGASDQFPDPAATLPATENTTLVSYFTLDGNDSQASALIECGSTSQSCLIDYYSLDLLPTY